MHWWLEPLIIPLLIATLALLAIPRGKNPVASAGASFSSHIGGLTK